MQTQCVWQATHRLHNTCHEWCACMGPDTTHARQKKPKLGHHRQAQELTTLEPRGRMGPGPATNPELRKHRGRPETNIPSRRRPGQDRKRGKAKGPRAPGRGLRTETLSWQTLFMSAYLCCLICKWLPWPKEKCVVGVWSPSAPTRNYSFRKVHHNPAQPVSTCTRN